MPTMTQPTRSLTRQVANLRAASFDQAVRWRRDRRRWTNKTLPSSKHGLAVAGRVVEDAEQVITPPRFRLRSTVLGVLAIASVALLASGVLSGVFNRLLYSLHLAIAG